MRELVMPKDLRCGFIVKVSSERDAEELLSALDDAGYRWMSEERLTTKTYFHENTTGSLWYLIDARKRLMFSRIGIKRPGYMSYEYDDLMREIDSEENDATFAAEFERILKT